MNFVFIPLSIIDTSICPNILSDPLLLALYVLAFVCRSFRPGLRALSILKIIFPVPFVAWAFQILINTMSIRFIIWPLSLVCISISMGKLALTFCLIVRPLTFKFCFIWPLHHTVAMTHSAEPLSIINSASRVLIFFLLNFSFVLKHTSERFFRFALLKILLSFFSNHFLNSVLASH